MHSTVSRILRRRKWTQKELRRISLERNEHLRAAYCHEMSQFNASDLVFLDESIFNEKTGWCYRAYAPIGHEIQYICDTDRGKTWAVLAAMTIDGWMPGCTALKRVYFSREDFVMWLKN